MGASRASSWAVLNFSTSPCAAAATGAGEGAGAGCAPSGAGIVASTSAALVTQLRNR